MSTIYLTADLPGTGGRLRASTSDFLVEELPLYEPSGSGDHLYVRIEKTGLSTHDAVRRIARALRVRPRDVGYAGLKDARAVTVQTLSIEHVDDERARDALADLDGIRVLGLSRHRNKIRLGHLAGNRFTLRVRDVNEEAEVRAGAILRELEARGCPNWFGVQRFGRRGDNDRVGRALIRRRPAEAVRALLGDAGSADDGLDASRAFADEGSWQEAFDAAPRGARTEAAVLREMARGREPERALRAVPRKLLRLLVSAYQSRLFNTLLAERLPTLSQMEIGDLAYLHDRGAVFAVEDAEAAQLRADTLEISPSAPLFGTRLLFADGEPGARERALLEAEGLVLHDFNIPGAGSFRGERRPLRIPLREVTAERAPPGDDGERTIVVRFVLPRGCYATTVLGEILKTPETAPPRRA